MTSNKQELRHMARKVRDAIPPEIRDIKAKKICEQILAQAEAYRKQQNKNHLLIASYIPMGSELDLLELRNIANEAQYSFAMPCMNEDFEMEFYSCSKTCIENRDLPFLFLPAKKLDTGSPDFKAKLEQCKATYVKPEELDLILCPMLAFDKQGNRLGYGGGCYDKYLSQIDISNKLLLGVAFAQQEFAQLPHEPHDIKLETIITA